jgi:hypothetical protein
MKHKKRKLSKFFSLQRIMAFLLITLMVGSMFGVVISGLASSDKFKFNGLTFKYNQQGYYYTKINGKEYSFYNKPEDILNLNLNSEIDSVLKNKNEMIIAFNPNMTQLDKMDIIRADFAQFFTKEKMSFNVNGITTTSNNYPTASIANCYMSNQTRPIIIFEESKNFNISLDKTNKNCIIVNTNTISDRVKARDYIMYKILNII